MSHEPANSQLQVPKWEKSLGSAGLICLFIAFIHVILTRLCWANIPLQTDTGMWAYIGGRILNGALPYRDLWESKPPGVYYVFAAVEGLFGRFAVDALVWLDGAVSLAVLVVSYKVARLFGSALCSALATMLLSLVFCHRIIADWGNNVEKFVALFEMTACWILLSSRQKSANSRWVWLAAGGAMGLAGLFKQTGIAMLAASTVHTFWSCRVMGRKFSEARRFVGLIWAGFAVIWLPVAIWLWVTGSWSGFVDQVLLYDVFRAASPTVEGSRLLTAEHWRSVGQSFRLGLILFGPALIMLFAVLRSGLLMRKSNSNPMSPKAEFQRIGLTLVGLYAAAALVPSILAPHGYGHYLLQAAPPCAVLMASLLVLIGNGRASAATRLVCLLSVIMGYFPIKDHLRFTFKGDTDNGAYASQRRRISQLVKAIDQNTIADDHVMIWPPDYAVSYYANRVTPLEFSNADVLFKGKSYRLSPPMDQLLARLKADPPEFIFDHTGIVLESSSEGPFVKVQPAFSFLEEPVSEHPMLEGRLLAPLKRWVRKNYGGQSRAGPATIYRRGQPWREWSDYLIENGEFSTPRSAE
ncbi:MAG: glycosyltransferase family 39 protein [Planctomycetes bacterium]|nr:glycosyltransferase family 39 protein [Planctomycetota bacterium]